MFKYYVRAFCIQQGSQVGDTLDVPHRGVEATLRAGPGRIIVKVLGQQSIASVWISSEQSSGWILVHEELSWVKLAFSPQ